MNTTTEKPILFSTSLVRAILDGRKTVTRRVMKPQPSEGWHPYDYGEVHKLVNGVPDVDKPIGWGPTSADGLEAYKSPYGQPGTELWVRETHAYVPKTAYQASVGIPQVINPEDDYEAAIFRASFDRSQGGIRWRPSIHMPRWASRIQLKVTDIRVERVQEITYEDICREGISFQKRPVFAAVEFEKLWDSINADRGYSWESNPWVWCISFNVKDIKGA